MAAHLKRLCLVLLCVLCVPVFGQDKEFRAGMKKGKTANGYYRADFSKMAFPQAELNSYAEQHGLVLKNVVEKEVVQFGTRYVAVVSVDFLPIDELSSVQAASGLGSDTGPVDAKTKDLVHLLNTSFNAQNEKDIVSFSQVVELGKDRYAMEDLKKAGFLCGYVLYLKQSGSKTLFGPVNEYFYFMSYESMEKRLCDTFNGGNRSSFPSTGTVLHYPYADRPVDRGFRETGDVKWTGNCVDGKLDGPGFGYRLNEGDVTVTCVVGRFDQGKPVGECSFYSFPLTRLVDSNIPAPVKVNVHPFREGIARCDILLKEDGKNDYAYVAFVDGQYRNVVADANQLAADVVGEYRYSNQARVVREYENGSATLACKKASMDLEFEFFVDRQGHATGLSDKTQAAIDGILDDMASQYDKYLSKVINPTDIIRPVSKLKSYGYDLSQFPIRAYEDLTRLESVKPALERYRSRKSNKPELAYDTYKLLDLTRELEDDYKRKLEDRVMDQASTIRLVQGNILNQRRTRLSDFSFDGTFDYSRTRAQDYMDRIGSSPQKPSNFAATRAAVDKGFTEASRWWSGVTERAGKVLERRIASDQARIDEHRREMCEKCLVDGRESTFPKGYVEGYEGIFISRPAESEKEGVLYLQNGEKCTWKYVFYSSKTEISLSGAYSGTFDSVHEMIDTVIRQCNEHWGRR